LNAPEKTLRPQSFFGGVQSGEQGEQYRTSI